MRIEQFFCEHPVFRHEAFASWKASKGEIKPKVYFYSYGGTKSTTRCIFLNHLKSVDNGNYVVLDGDLDAFMAASLKQGL